MPPRELVDKVDKLLDGDAGSRRFAFAHLVPSAPARSTPTLDKGWKHRFSYEIYSHDIFVRLNK